MKKYLIGILVVLFVGAGGYFLFSSSTPAQKSTETGPQTIVAFGDSLVAGNGSSDGNDFVSVLSRKIKAPIINKGIPGETTADGLKRIQTIVDLNPDIVIVLFGGNDALQQKPVDQTFKNLGDIISTFQSHGTKVVLLGIQGGILGDKYKTPFSDLAKKYKVTFVPNVLGGIIGRDDLMSDTVHPNDKGYQLVANKVYTAISPLINTQ